MRSDIQYAVFFKFEFASGIAVDFLNRVKPLDLKEIAWAMQQCYYIYFFSHPLHIENDMSSRRRMDTNLAQSNKSGDQVKRRYP